MKSPIEELREQSYGISYDRNNSGWRYSQADGRPATITELADSQPLVPLSTAEEIVSGLQAENERLKRGEFTEQETDDFCPDTPFVVLERKLGQAKATLERMAMREPTQHCHDCNRTHHEASEAIATLTPTPVGGERNEDANAGR